MKNLIIFKMKNKVLITLMLSLGFISLSASNYVERRNYLDGTYYNENGKVGFVISGDFMSVYVHDDIFSIPLTCTLNFINKCYIKYEGSNIYNIDSVMFLDESAIDSITVKQDDELPVRTISANSSNDEDEYNDIVDEADKMNVVQSDSVRVDFIFPNRGNHKYDKLSVQSMYVIDNVILEYFYGGGSINSDTLSIYMPPTTERFEFTIDFANPNYFGRKITKWHSLRYKKPISVTKKHVVVTLPKYGEYRDNLYYIVDEYFKVLYPGVIRWRGTLFYKIDNSEEYSNYIKY